MSDMTIDTAGRVTVTFSGAVADVRLNRPEKRNALAMAKEIRALIGSPNQAEAVTARFEKRDPSFGEA